MTNAVEYAEKTLNVHEPWDDARQRLEVHSQASTAAIALRTEIRSVKVQIKDRTATIRAEAPSQVPNFSDYNTTQRREAIKILIDGDEELMKFEHRLSECQSELDDCNAEIKHAELGISACTARMTELGGLLQFYAEAKAAETSRVLKSTEQLRQE